ncbi:DUF6602 domain-containing protein [Mucilaginibacter pocheonensis]|uniref:DUF6602 domain-containing protein n=1 Tax=Mucilaginibacter pocheonensis TaxID=398050 RepID=A0ABU1TCC0_9SPHI|nr:DUF6602 domain-containing protein [Mucilaginibacter pocheonensis]MDR6942934.1 hypothetical protein [Mucilaginibacter pocheonensis]
MSNDQSSLKIQIPNQGWRQFLTGRDDMLAAYDRARVHSSKRTVQTGHGNVAEAEFRKWLSDFLPKRYGVTSGFIISQGVPNSEDFVHYDVIIYDKLESPVLWVEGAHDAFPSGRSMAIPVEYVCGVIEVKAVFNKKSVKQAVEQLRKLRPLMGISKPSIHDYRFYLPKNFFCAAVFFELHKSNEKDFGALDAFLEGSDLRNFYGGYVLRPESHEIYSSGIIKFEYLRDDEKPNNNSLLFWAYSKCKKLGDLHLRARLNHSEAYFSEFAFDIIALLRGSYKPYALSSMYGFGTTDWEKGSAVSVTYANPDDVKKYNEETEKFLRNNIKNK